MTNQNIPSYKIVLCAEVPEEKRDLQYVFSIEAGLHDGVRHFDHHKPEHRANPSPANNPKIHWYFDGEFEKDAEIYISHVDADTFLGVSRLVKNGWSTGIVCLDFSVIEKIDLNGSSAIEGPLENCREYLFALGLAENAKILFPRCTKEPQDVTAQFGRFEWFGDRHQDDLTLDDILRDGRAALARSEETYRSKKIDSIERAGFAVGIGLWSIGASDAFDPSRPYRDGIDVVVVYRSHYKSISLYGNPKATHGLVLNHVWSGIEFAGHPKACGSPRGVEMTEEQAKQVFRALVEKNA